MTKPPIQWKFQGLRCAALTQNPGTSFSGKTNCSLAYANVECSGNETGSGRPAGATTRHTPCSNVPPLGRHRSGSQPPCLEPYLTWTKSNSRGRAHKRDPVNPVQRWFSPSLSPWNGRNCPSPYQPPPLKLPRFCYELSCNVISGSICGNLVSAHERRPLRRPPLKVNGQVSCHLHGRPR